MLKNLGTVNKNEVRIITDTGIIDLCFSYETIVSVSSGKGYFVSQNEWSTTTGKLLNELEPDKSKRIPHAELMQKVNEVLQSI